MRSIPLLFLIALALTGCSWTRGATINTASSVPAFVFTNESSSGFKRFEEEACVTSLAVLEGSAPVWRIDADQEPCRIMAGVTYGVVPAGFEQQQAAMPLAKNTVYELRYESIGEYPNVGLRWFCVGENGDILDVKWKDGVARDCDD